VILYFTLLQKVINGVSGNNIALEKIGFVFSIFVSRKKFITNFKNLPYKTFHS
jgi:hypothetical protein